MKLSKKQRQEVWKKSNGVCWYCGCTLPTKGWHADHCEAVRRTQVYENTHYNNPDGALNPENHKLENIVPACAPCNLFKSVFTIEEFRQELQQQSDRARKYSVNFRMAEKFGLIETTNKQVLFWFETGTPAQNSAQGGSDEN